MRSMAMMAHPDDAEIWCGGRLILQAEKQDVVRICILSYTEQPTNTNTYIKPASPRSIRLWWVCRLLCWGRQVC